MSKQMRLIFAYFLAEVVGTFLLVVIGDGAIAAYVLQRRQVDPFCACFAFGVGAMIGTFAAAKISGAHLNPAASLAFALDKRLSWKLLPVYLLGQYLGGFLAALVLYVNYYQAIWAIDAGEHKGFGASDATGQIFATYPAQYVSSWGSLLDQLIGTSILLFSLSAVGDKNNTSLEQRHQPLVIAFVIGIICVAFSPNCGAIFNPARDLTPRLLTYLVGYESVWQPINGQYWFVAGVLGPHLGAILGVFAYKFLIGSSIEYLQNNNNNDQAISQPQQQQYTRKQIDPQITLPMASMADSYNNLNNNNTNNNPQQRAALVQRQHDVDYGSTN